MNPVLCFAKLTKFSNHHRNQSKQNTFIESVLYVGPHYKCYKYKFILLIPSHKALCEVGAAFHILYMRKLRLREGNFCLRS